MFLSAIKQFGTNRRIFIQAAPARLSYRLNVFQEVI